MRRNNLARNLERIKQRDELAYANQVAQWIAQGDKDRSIAMNKAYAKSQVAFNEGYHIVAIDSEQELRDNLELVKALEGLLYEFEGDPCYAQSNEVIAARKALKSARGE